MAWAVTVTVAGSGVGGELALGVGEFDGEVEADGVGDVDDLGERGGPVSVEDLGQLDAGETDLVGDVGLAQTSAGDLLAEAAGDDLLEGTGWPLRLGRHDAK